MIVTHRPPSSCPVCSTTLITLRLGCPQCGTELSGHFSSCRYCRLDTADLEILEVFLRGRGNVRDIQAHLAVSYPTARARLQDVLDRLGLGDGSGSAHDRPAATPRPTATSPAATSQAAGPDSGGMGRARDVSGPGPRAQAAPTSPPGGSALGAALGQGDFVAAVLAELASGRIDVAAAEALIDRFETA